DEIADLLEEEARRGDVVRLAGAGLQPLVDAGLELIALLEERLIARAELANDVLEQRPDRVGLDARAGRDIVANQIVKGLGDFEPADGNVFGHLVSAMKRKETRKESIATNASLLCR